MVGDTPWDIEAARRAGIDRICLLTGGVARCELTDAVAVYESLDEFRAQLDKSGLR